MGDSGHDLIVHWCATQNYQMLHHIVPASDGEEAGLYKSRRMSVLVSRLSCEKRRDEEQGKSDVLSGESSLTVASVRAFFCI
jgi:hypothetical protein